MSWGQWYKRQMVKGWNYLTEDSLWQGRRSHQRFGAAELHIALSPRGVSGAGWLCTWCQLSPEAISPRLFLPLL